MKRQDFRFSHRLRVRWVEVDLQKIVFNGHYLMYFDTAVTDYWRALAFPYHEGMQALQGDLYVKKSSIEYHASAELDDWLDVAMRCERVGNSSITFTGAIFRGEEHLISAEIIYVFADPATQTSRPVPPILRGMLTDYEQGASMTELHLGRWDAMRAMSSPLREQVFVKEQGVPADMEWDPADETALHAVVQNRMGMALATGRLMAHAPGIGRIGRMAVMRHMRGSDLGHQVLQALMQAARERGDHQVILHAQCSAEGFYRKAGFVTHGEIFEEAGICHIEMHRALQCV